MLSIVLDRRQERAERSAAHAIERRKKAAEADARLKRFYDAIENGVADVEDELLKERIAELRALKSQAQGDAERATVALKTIGAEITPTRLHALPTLRARGCAAPTAATAATTSALAQRVEVADREIRIIGSRSNLPRRLAAASGVPSAAGGVPSFVPKWRIGSPYNAATLCWVGV